MTSTAERMRQELAHRTERLDRANRMLRAVAPSLLAVVSAATVGAVLIAISDPAVRMASSDPMQGLGTTLTASWAAIAGAYGALLAGAFGGLGPLSETLVATTPLLLAGLGVALPLRAGLFNIGGEGQLLVGAMAACTAGFVVPLPPGVHLLVALTVGVGAGAVWGGLSGWLRARSGAHEVITTIMLNVVAANLLLLWLRSDGVRRPDRTDPVSRVVSTTAQLPQIPGLRLHAGLMLALLAAAAIGWLLYRSTFGFDLRAVGASPEAARAAGIRLDRTWLAAMGLGGGLAGLAGAVQILGVERSLSPGFSSGLGFEAITVALLGRAEPRGVVPAALLFGALRSGGLRMQAATGTPVDLVVVMQALIVLAIAAPALVSWVLRTRTPRVLTSGVVR